MSRDYGGDPRSGELVESMQRHQRAISEHEGALLHDVAQFDRTEAWRGDGVPCASATFMSVRSLVERSGCPVCGASESRVVIDLPYDDEPIGTYLERFYGGRFDQSLVAGERYVLSKCGRCGLLFQSFVPGPALLDSLYGSVALADLQEVAQSRGLSVRQGYSYQVEEFIKYWGGDPSSLRVLDFGSGTGLWLRMVDAYGCETHAAELVESHVEHFKARGVLVHPVTDLPANTFHFINAEQVFEHLVAPSEVIQHLGGSLAPGGLLRISVPNRSGLDSLIGDPDWAAPKGSSRSLNAIAPLEHINCYDRGSLLTLGHQAGLELFEYPLRQFMQSMERVRFVASALVHVVRRPAGTSPMIFRRPGG